MKKLVVMMVSLLCLSACQSEDITPGKKERVDIPLTKSEVEMVSGGNDFAFNLFRKIDDSQTQPVNTFISPISVSYAFSMLNNGANGVTRKEIQQVLGNEGFTPEEVNAFCKKMMVASRDLDPQVTVETANSVWLRNNLPVLSPFTDACKQSFNAEVKNVDFAQSQTLDQINRWASDKTHGKIPFILNKLNPDAVFYLMNALYFKGDWKEPFDKKLTKNESFTNADGNVSSVPMMNNTLTTLYFENDTYSMVYLPYGNSAFNMMVLLPHKEVTVSSVLSGLNDHSWQEMLKRPQGYQVRLKLPRFQASYEIELNEILDDLGMHSAFDASVADFSLLSSSSSFLSLALQKAVVQVNEEGTEAAAVTVVGGDLMSPGPRPTKDFYVDRPFIYIIQEISTGAIFFMGAIQRL